jgi:hypothetical protein
MDLGKYDAEFLEGYCGQSSLLLYTVLNRLLFSFYLSFDT